MLMAKKKTASREQFLSTKSARCTLPVRFFYISGSRSFLSLVSLIMSWHAECYYFK